MIGERTRELLGPAARVEALGTVAVKGKHDPVRAFRLLTIE